MIPESDETPRRGPLLVIHGGAGVPASDRLEPGLRADAEAGLQRALLAGHKVLAAGGAALDAVEAAVLAMEENEAFNAGIGGALTSAGHVEHDAAIMDGALLRAGAITGTRIVRNPILLARKVLEAGQAVCLAGDGAEAFARETGQTLVDAEVFVTERRRQALMRVKAGKSKHAPPDEQDKHGTVGAVAVDAAGHLAAATSTGGRTNKRPGRVGDSPIIGAGTYADDRTVAVSCTGSGESFMRLVLAHRMAALVELAGLPVAVAAERCIAELGVIGGTGGLIAVDASGRMAMPFNTAGMYRGWIGADGQPHTMIHRD